MVLNLADALEGHIPGNMILYGPTGAGKTAAARFVIQQLEERAEAIGSSVTSHEVNAQHTNTRYRVLHSIATRLREKGDVTIPFTGWPADRVLEETVRRMDRRSGVHVIVLDEMDRLAAQSEEQLLYDLTTLNVLLSTARASIIGISNDFSFTDSLTGPIRSRLAAEDIVFIPYTADQVNDILINRAKDGLREGTWDESGIRLCADLVAKEHGDARRAIDLLRVSAQRAEIGDANSINIEHVISAQAQMEQDRAITLMQGLPEHQKLILMSILINQRNGVHTQNSGTIWETYTQACSRAGFRPLTSRRVSTIINEFDSAGLAHVRNVFLGRHGRTKHVYSLIPKGIDAIQILAQDNPGLEAASKGAYKLQKRLG
tara:strand:+ start:1877 stop:2998 length:1122 start_codon:yes stop_codon:yes gene_type:complete